MVDLSELITRLDSNERIRLTYRFPISTIDGKVEYETREGKLLDVAEESKLLYVSHGGEVIWVKLEEALSVSSAGSE